MSNETGDDVFHEIVEELADRTDAQGVFVLLLHRVRIGHEVDLLGESYVVIRPASDVDESTLLMAAINGLSPMISDIEWQKVVAAMKEETLHRARKVQEKSDDNRRKGMLH